VVAAAAINLNDVLVTVGVVVVVVATTGILA